MCRPRHSNCKVFQSCEFFEWMFNFFISILYYQKVFICLLILFLSTKLHQEFSYVLVVITSLEWKSKSHQKKKSKGPLFDDSIPTRIQPQNKDNHASQEKASGVIITKRTQEKIQFQLSN